MGILKQTDNGVKTSELCRQHGISEQTLYSWKANYGGLEVSDAKKLKQLEDGNRKLKHVVAELTLNDVLGTNWKRLQARERRRII